jgi:hypothetical protein
MVEEQSYSQELISCLKGLVVAVDIDTIKKIITFIPLDDSEKGLNKIKLKLWEKHCNIYKDFKKNKQYLWFYL